MAKLLIIIKYSLISSIFCDIIAAKVDEASLFAITAANRLCKKRKMLRGKNNMKIQESGEMYLETILVLAKRNNLVRSIDVAEYMGFSKPAVSRAMSKLKADKLIIIDNDGYIALTESGREIAEKIYERHQLLTTFLIHIGVDEKTAAADACKIEHDISDTTFEAMKKHALLHKN